jgi:hypothetical protein
MAISTPERDRDRDATSVPIKLAAPLKRRARRVTTKSAQQPTLQEQPDLSADESDTIQVKSSQPALQTRKSSTNKDLLIALTEIIWQQNETIKTLQRQTDEIRENQQVLIDHNTKLIDEVAELKARVDDLTAVSSGARSWASVAAASTPTGLNAIPGRSASHQHFSSTSPAPSPSDAPNVTVDISRADSENGRMSAGMVRAAIEKEMRTLENQANWRCRAVTVDHLTQSRIRIACRSEDEHQLVKRAAEKIGAGARVLRDELFPVKIDNVRRTAVLDEKDEIRVGVAEAFSEENRTTVTKIAWLSKRDIPKAYRSMVVYVTKRSDARRLIAEGFFHAGGESGTTSAFEHRPRPGQCYNCQELGHKVYQCKKTQRCGRCAKDGHHYKSCSEVVMKCVLCRGPHESSSRNCQMLYPPQHE